MLVRAMAFLRSLMQRWYWRMPLKWLVMLGVTLVVLFPYPRMFVRQIRHLSNLNAMIEPDHPAFTQWDDEIREHIRQRQIWKAEGHKRADAAQQRPQEEEVVTSRPLIETRPLSPYNTQVAVQEFVYRKVQYDWDWNTWGMADYIPTIGEMFEYARENGGVIREDCDGRAVMAASLMRRLGFEAQIVTDVKHVWVVTPQGEWMGPGEGAKALKSTPEGSTMAWWSAIGRLPSAIGFGISVFPWTRQTILLATLFLLLYHRRAEKKSTIIGVALLVQGWLFLRCHGEVWLEHDAYELKSWPQLVGIIHVFAALAWLLGASYRARRGEPVLSHKAIPE